MAEQHNQTLPVGNITADELQDARLYIFVPAITIYCIVLLIAIVGNLLILYIIGFKYRLSTYKIQLLSLAFFDVVGTFIYMPLIIYEQFMYYNFQSEPACRIVRFLAYYVGAGSAITLLAITIERHQKICKPLGKQITPRQAKWIALLIALFISNALSIPLAVAYVVREDTTIHRGLIVKTYTCQPDTQSDRLQFTKVWQGFLLLLVAVFTVVMAVLYFKIWKKVVKGGLPSPTQRADQFSMTHKIPPNGTKFTSHDPYPSRSNTVVSKHSAGTSSNQYHVGRIAKMSLALTVVFVITYAPSVSLNIVKALNPNFVESLKPSARSAYEFFYKSNIINFVANPFIYGLMDHRFRAQLKNIFHCM